MFSINVCKWVNYLSYLCFSDKTQLHYIAGKSGDINVIGENKDCRGIKLCLSSYAGVYVLVLLVSVQL